MAFVQKFLVHLEQRITSNFNEVAVLCIDHSILLCECEDRKTGEIMPKSTMKVLNDTKSILMHYHCKEFDQAH